MVLIRDVMRTAVQTLAPDESVFSAAKKMAFNRVSCLVIVDNRKITGIITERDIVERVVAQQREPETTPAGEVMTSDVKVIDQGEELRTASELMKIGKFKQLPVTYMDDLVGIITLTDLSRFEY
jgi:CBS domain-containing protein